MNEKEIHACLITFRSRSPGGFIDRRSGDRDSHLSCKRSFHACAMIGRVNIEITMMYVFQQDVY